MTFLQSQQKDPRSLNEVLVLPSCLRWKLWWKMLSKNVLGCVNGMHMLLKPLCLLLCKPLWLQPCYICIASNSIIYSFCLPSLCGSGFGGLGYFCLTSLVALSCKPCGSIVLEAFCISCVASLGGSLLLQALVALYCCKPWWLYTVASLGGSILLQDLVALLWKPWEPMLKWFIVQCGFFGVGLAQK